VRQCAGSGLLIFCLGKAPGPAQTPGKDIEPLLSQRDPRASALVQALNGFFGLAHIVALLIVLIAAQRRGDEPIPTRPGLLLPEDV
jgi:hypothetical protein